MIESERKWQVLLVICCRFSQSWQAIHLLSLYQTQTGETVKPIVLPQHTRTHRGELGLMPSAYSTASIATNTLLTVSALQF